MMLTQNFSTDEMACHCCGEADMDEEFMKSLQAIRSEMQRPLKISSGFRCEKHNSEVSSTGSTGPHTHARAADILISGADAVRLLDIARKYGMTGIGLQQKGPHTKRFIHLDNLGPDYAGPRPFIWSY